MAESVGVDVLVGHRVSDVVNRDALGPDSRNTVRAEALAAWLDERSDWSPLGFADLERDSLPERSFMLTLDDGYRDNLTTALPVLEARDVPVLIFVTTGFIDRESEPMEAELARLAQAVELLRLPGGREIPCDGANAKSRAYETVRRELKAGGISRRDRLFAEILKLNGDAKPAAADEFLSWREVIELDRHPLVTIGAHTLTHPLLTAAAGREAFHEIHRSRTRLEEQLGHPVDAFAYPYGGHNLWVRRLVSRAGFRWAFTTEPRPLRRAPSRRAYRIPRRDLGDAIGNDSA